MKQYLKLVQDIRQYGSKKGEARENMPHTTSYFGPQMEFDLKDGFPILTTKKVSFKAIKVELFWFLSGNTNIKFLVDRGVNVWNEDAYNYYVKVLEKQGMYPVRFEDFVNALQTNKTLQSMESVHGGIPKNYTLGDCGMQYGKLWRDWEGVDRPEVLSLKTDHLNTDQLIEFRKQWNKAIESNKPMLINSELEPKYLNKGIDQLSDLLEGLHKNPMSRRHIISAWNPVTLDQMALPACHSFVQFNVRELTLDQRLDLMRKRTKDGTVDYDNRHHEFLNYHNIPKYAIDCKMYQRSADVFLGVPFNIASYALLTQIIAQLLNFEVGRFIHTFGDAHIYSNHEEQLDEQLTREPLPLPNLVFGDINAWRKEGSIENRIMDFLLYLQSQQETDFLIDSLSLDNYQSHSGIKGKLSTGLK